MYFSDEPEVIFIVEQGGKCIMGSFCMYCGRPLSDGEVCNCKDNQSQNPQQNQFQFQQQSQQENQYQQQKQQQDWTQSATAAFGDAQDLFSNMKDRMGIGEQEYNDDSVYEDNLRIIPDIVKANDGEVPIRQYKIATLRNKFLGITYAKATGRIQITNKRVIFRAPGKSIIGTRTSLQHEFLIDEIGGIEARREHMFNKGDMLLGFLVALVGFIITASFMFGCVEDMYRGEGAAFAIYFLALVLGIGGLVPFFVVKQKWLLKMLFTGVSVGALSIPALIEGNWFFKLLALIAFIIAVINALLCSIRPNLVLSIKPKGAAGVAIDIRRTSTGIGGLLQKASSADSDDHTGFKEIFPEEDAEKAIRELGAVIDDIQKLGDYAVSKWQE